MKAIFEIEVDAQRNTRKILLRLMDRMEKAAMGDRQTKTVSIRLVETEEDDDD